MRAVVRELVPLETAPHDRSMLPASAGLVKLVDVARQPGSVAVETAVEWLNRLMKEPRAAQVPL